MNETSSVRSEPSILARSDQAVGFQSHRTIVLGMLIGTGGLIIYGIMPIVLGSLLDQGRINAAQLGLAATAETLCTALGLLLGSRVLGRAETRWIVALSGLIMAAANFRTLVATGPATIILARGVAGFGEGVLVAVPALSIAFSLAPARLSAVFLTVTTPPTLVLAYMLPSYLMPRFGPDVGFNALALAGLVCSVFAVCIRDDFARRAAKGSGRVRWSLLSCVVLAGILLSSAGYAAAWSYVDPLGASYGLAPGAIGSAVTATIVGQFLVSLFVASAGWRMPMLATLIGTSVVQIIVSTLLLWAGTPLSFALLLTVFGLLWQGATPFATALLVSIDESRALAPLVFPLQLIGLALGPFFASFVAGIKLSAVLILADGLYAATLVVYLMVGPLATSSNVILPKFVARDAA